MVPNGYKKIVFGDGEFKIPKVLPGCSTSDCDTTDESRSVYVADLNDDGRPDIVTVGDSGGKLLLNEEGGYPTKSDFSAARDVVIEDLDGDGRPDIVLAINHDYGEDKVLWNEGGNPFSTETLTAKTLPGGEQISHALAVKDLDIDGHPYIIVVNTDTYEENYVIFNNGNRSFEEKMMLKGGYPTSFSVAEAHLNDDDYVDIVIGNDREFSDYVYINTGEKDFDVHEIPCSRGLITRGVHIADMNGDGINDIIFGIDGSQNRLLINLGDGITFEEPNGEGSSWF